MRAERITDSLVHHGEGPVWWPRLDALRFVDMLAGDVMTRDESGAVTRTPTGSRIAAVIRPRRAGGAVVALEDRLTFADAEDLSDLRATDPVFIDPGLRFNEGGCDPAGRFYCGTMAYAKTPGAATVYRFDAGSDRPTPVLTGVTVANGLGWSPDGATAYFNDTPTGLVAAIADDPQTGLGERRAFATIDEADGRPDGLCVDAEGGVWVALNGGGRIHRYDPDGVLDAVVDVGARQVTACTFGGKDLATLFVTTSREDLPPGQDPAAGSLFAATPGVKGLAPLAFAG